MGTLDERVGLAMGRGRGGKTDHEGYHSVQVDTAALTLGMATATSKSARSK